VHINKVKRSEQGKGVKEPVCDNKRLHRSGHSAEFEAGDRAARN
jgi:hypothetical protein